MAFPGLIPVTTELGQKLVGISWSLRQQDGTLIASGTTDAQGQINLIPNDGDYNIFVDWPLNSPVRVRFVVGGNGSIGSLAYIIIRPLLPPPPPPPVFTTYKFTIFSPNQATPLNGATVAIRKFDGSLYASVVTAAPTNGVATFSLPDPPGVVDWYVHVTCPGYVTVRVPIDALTNVTGQIGVSPIDEIITLGATPQQGDPGFGT